MVQQESLGGLGRENDGRWLAGSAQCLGRSAINRVSDGARIPDAQPQLGLGLDFNVVAWAQPPMPHTNTVRDSTDSAFGRRRYTDPDESRSIDRLNVARRRDDRHRSRPQRGLERKEVRWGAFRSGHGSIPWHGQNHERETRHD